MNASNLDCERHRPTDYACPCLPAVWWRGDKVKAVTYGRLYHDAPVARVLRSEGGHP